MTASTQYPITFNKSDLAIFDQTYDLQNPPSFTVVGQDGGARPYFKPGTYNPVDAYETAMDVEWAHAMAPEASIVLIETTADNTAADRDCGPGCRSGSRRDGRVDVVRCRTRANR